MRSTPSASVRATTARRPSPRQARAAPVVDSTALSIATRVSATTVAIGIFAATRARLAPEFRVRAPARRWPRRAAPRRHRCSPMPASILAFRSRRTVATVSAAASCRRVAVAFSGSARRIRQALAAPSGSMIRSAVLRARRRLPAKTAVTFARFVSAVPARALLAPRRMNLRVVAAPRRVDRAPLVLRIDTASRVVVSSCRADTVQKIVSRQQPSWQKEPLGHGSASLHTRPFSHS